MWVASNPLLIDWVKSKMTDTYFFPIGGYRIEQPTMNSITMRGYGVSAEHRVSKKKGKFL